MYGLAGRGTYSNPNSFASLLYNGMIAPLAGYGIKGAIWYQGENNADRARSYRELFPAMIRDWQCALGIRLPLLLGATGQLHGCGAAAGRKRVGRVARSAE